MCGNLSGNRSRTDGIPRVEETRRRLATLRGRSQSVRHPHTSHTTTGSRASTFDYLLILRKENNFTNVSLFRIRTTVSPTIVRYFCDNFNFYFLFFSRICNATDTYVCFTKNKHWLGPMWMIFPTSLLKSNFFPFCFSSKFLFKVYTLPPHDTNNVILSSSWPTQASDYSYWIKLGRGGEKKA